MTNLHSQDKPNGNKMNFNLRQWMFITASELNALFYITERNSLVPAYKYRTSLDVAFRGLEPLLIIERIVWYLPHVQNCNHQYIHYAYYLFFSRLFFKTHFDKKRTKTKHK